MGEMVERVSRENRGYGIVSLLGLNQKRKWECLLGNKELEEGGGGRVNSIYYICLYACCGLFNNSYG